MGKTIKARVIFSGHVTGEVVFSDKPLTIYTGIDVITGKIVERGHPLRGKMVSGKVLVFPEAAGSTVGSWTLLQLKKNGVAPVAIVNTSCETIVATGVIMARIPCVDKVDILLLKDCKNITIHDDEITTRDL